MKQIGVLIAWLSGSLAGITAGLYALGFLATVGADQLLGIDSTLNVREPAFYVGRGGQLLMRTLIIGMWPALLVLGAAGVVRWMWSLPPAARVDPSDRMRRIGRAAAAPSAAIGMFALAMIGLGAYVLPALDAGDLLFTSSIPAATCEAENPLTLAMFARDRQVLDEGFTWMAIYAGAAVGIAVLARDRLTEAGQGAWLAIAAIAGFFLMVEVPLAYGLMAVEVSPHTIELASPPGAGEGPLRLLARLDDGLLVWLEQERRVLWIRSSELAWFTIGAGKAIPALGCGPPS